MFLGNTQGLSGLAHSWLYTGGVQWTIWGAEDQTWVYACKASTLLYSISLVSRVSLLSLHIFLVLWPHPVMLLRGYSWLCAHESFLVSLGNMMEGKGSNLGQQCARQVPYPVLVYSLSSPSFQMLLYYKSCQISFVHFIQVISILKSVIMGNMIIIVSTP